MNKIKLSLLQHKGANQIKIDFNYDFKTKEYIKNFPLVKWSATHKTFYLPFSKENTNNFYIYLKKKGFEINFSKLVAKVNEDNLSNETKDKIIEFTKWLYQMRYSESTIKTYTSMIKLFFRNNNKKVDEITKKDVESFNNEYVLKKGYSYVYQNQLVNALKLFYKYNTKSILDLEELDRPKKSKKLPEVLSIDEVKLILSSIKNIKHKTLLSLLYSCGLRIGEALNTKINAIDLNRKLLHIKSGKGRKDRFVPISPTMVSLLKNYITLYKPKEFLFEGQNNPYYSSVSARKVLNKAKSICRIQKEITLHTLRHSYATHLLENGTDIRFIQELLGHNNPKTTMIYTHVSTTSLEKIKNPFDDFEI